jgi:hypothetical protein
MKADAGTPKHPVAAFSRQPAILFSFTKKYDIN